MQHLTSYESQLYLQFEFLDSTRVREQAIHLFSPNAEHHQSVQDIIRKHALQMRQEITESTTEETLGLMVKMTNRSASEIRGAHQAMIQHVQRMTEQTGMADGTNFKPLQVEGDLEAFSLVLQTRTGDQKPDCEILQKIPGPGMNREIQLAFVAVLTAALAQAVSGISADLTKLLDAPPKDKS